MASENLAGKKIAFLVTDGFEEVELTKPREAIDHAGAVTHIVSPKSGKIKSWQHTQWGGEFDVDVNVKDAKVSDYDGLVLPGGVINPDHLRMDENAMKFVKEFFASGKPVAAICHGPWSVIEVGAAKGRKIASWPSLKTDIRNAGGTWVDEEVVRDGNLVTSRNPSDLPAFNREAIKMFADANAARPAA